MSDEIVVREARAEDWPGIWRALEPVFRAGETYTYPRDISEAEARTAWTALPGARVLVAVDPAHGEGAILGTAKYLPNQPGAGSHVANASFVVGPAGTGRGVGRALAGAVLDGARADGFLAMQFNAVVETNERAVRLWESFGFEILTTVPEAFSHPVHGLVGLHIMYRDL
ncbi:GNAT family N-acetyltransferase [Oerskovia merdavium]|uniref:GNAT family N-acetyltransferase n=1 Tax=Oerskovia merdavium TaxID=2762227 RepID=A0ABR8U1I9_9CELL|nr:GNAT family N-acetyltransferase [Oerskovia merdavium]MBD7981894.1 GNAT family N-acetyltransferase [Oerskovia merdavium]